MGDATLGHKVVHVGRPVLDGGVADFCPVQGHKFDHGGVQGIGGVGGCRAALDIVDGRAFVRDDQGPLELTHVLRIDAEVGLNRQLDVDAFGHVDERAPGPHRGVEGAELVVRVRHDGVEEALHQFRVSAQSRVHVEEEDALFFQILADAVVNRFRLVLRRDATQPLLFRVGDAKAIKGVLDVLWDVVPVALGAF